MEKQSMHPTETAGLRTTRRSANRLAGMTLGQRLRRARRKMLSVPMRTQLTRALVVVFFVALGMIGVNYLGADGSLESLTKSTPGAGANRGERKVLGGE
jgi:hypothetical protein